MAGGKLSAVMQIRVLIPWMFLLCAIPSAAQDSTPPYVAVVNGQDVRVNGSMALVSNGIATASGAHLESAKHNALLKLTRGGEIALCEASALTLTARESQLWLALQAGTMEARYPLSAGADTLLTADYRISIISGTGTPGQTADFRIGIGRHGDVLVQVLPTSEAYIVVSSNFETAQSVVRPGEVRGFPAFGSNLTAAQVTNAVPLRCPVEKTRQEALSASEGHEPVPADTLNIPLAYRAPELPVADPAPVQTATVSPPPPQVNAAKAEPPPAPVTSSAPEIVEVRPTETPQKAKHRNLFRSIGSFFKKIVR